jgi:hypothetical protein
MRRALLGFAVLDSALSSCFTPREPGLRCVAVSFVSIIRSMTSPRLGLQWILSSDGKTATYKDDPVGLLQSLPDGARLKINVAASSSHEAAFQIDGWDVVRNKIGTACKWARTTDKTSFGKR